LHHNHEHLHAVDAPVADPSAVQAAPSLVILQNTKITSAKIEGSSVCLSSGKTAGPQVKIQEFAQHRRNTNEIQHVITENLSNTQCTDCIAYFGIRK